MTIKKPKLSLDEQIEHLKDKGILFNIMDESDAKKYLEQNNNYFKLTAYRKNYNKHPDGKNKGKYINLEFAYLVDMAIIDMRLRYQIVHMALDIEHHAKLQLLRNWMSMMRMAIKSYRIILILWRKDRKRYMTVKSRDAEGAFIVVVLLKSMMMLNLYGRL